MRHVDDSSDCKRHPEAVLTKMIRATTLKRGDNTSSRYPLSRDGANEFAIQNVKVLSIGLGVNSRFSGNT